MAAALADQLPRFVGGGWTAAAGEDGVGFLGEEAAVLLLLTSLLVVVLIQRDLGPVGSLPA